MVTCVATKVYVNDGLCTYWTRCYCLILASVLKISCEILVNRTSCESFIVESDHD